MKSTGILRYSPKLLGGRSDKWWIVLDCDAGLGAYYRNLYWLAHYRTKRIERPAWAEHVTVVRDEEPPNKVAWERYPGRLIEFECGSEPKTDGHYWWLDVYCSELCKIREELGLLPDPTIPFHISFGHE